MTKLIPTFVRVVVFVLQLQCEVEMLRCYGQSAASIPGSNGPVASGHALPGGQNGAKGCGTTLSCVPNGNNKNGCCCPLQNFESDIQVDGIINQNNQFHLLVTLRKPGSQLTQPQPGTIILEN